MKKRCYKIPLKISTIRLQWAIKTLAIVSRASSPGKCSRYNEMRPDSNNRPLGWIRHQYFNSIACG